MTTLAKIMQAFLGIEVISIRERKAFSIQRGWTKFALRTIHKKWNIFGSRKKIVKPQKRENSSWLCIIRTLTASFLVILRRNTDIHYIFDTLQKSHFQLLNILSRKNYSRDLKKNYDGYWIPHSSGISFNSFNLKTLNFYPWKCCRSQMTTMSSWKTKSQIQMAK